MLTRQPNTVDLPLPLVIFVCVLVTLMVLRLMGRHRT